MELVRNSKSYAKTENPKNNCLLSREFVVAVTIHCACAILAFTHSLSLCVLTQNRESVFVAGNYPHPVATPILAYFYIITLEWPI